jgi:type VI secretion system protein VasD
MYWASGCTAGAATGAGAVAQPPTRSAETAINKPPKKREVRKRKKVGGIGTANTEEVCNGGHYIVDIAQRAIHIRGVTNETRHAARMSSPSQCRLPGARMPQRYFHLVIGTLFCVVLLTGCASGGIVDKSLEFVGLKKPEPPAGFDGELPKVQLQKQVTLRLHAAQVLNTDASGRSLALVTRIYKLRSTSQFMQATYPMFAAAGTEKPPFADDVISMQEVVLTPGQKHEVVETLPSEVSYIGVVALFRAPDNQRWRFVFDTKTAAKTGITLGAHGCAMSVAAGEPIGAQPDALRLAGVLCR